MTSKVGEHTGKAPQAGQVQQFGPTLQTGSTPQTSPTLQTGSTQQAGPILQTDRLILRPWCDDDAPSLFELARDPRVGPAAGWQPHANVEESRQIIRDVLAVPQSFAAARRADGALVGCFGLKPASASDVASAGEAELGYWLGVPFWGQGLATEAARELMRYGFDDLGLSAIWACYYDGNERSHRVMEKLGMTYVGSKECDVPLLGEHRLEHCMRRTRDNFQSCQIGDRPQVDSKGFLI